MTTQFLKQTSAALALSGILAAGLAASSVSARADDDEGSNGTGSRNSPK
jgi:hypothetical protein